MLHHGNPNIRGLDEDLDLMPFFAITDEDKRGKRGMALFYWDHQWVFVPIAMLMKRFQHTAAERDVGRATACEPERAATVSRN